MSSTDRTFEEEEEHKEEEDNSPKSKGEALQQLYQFEIMGTQSLEKFQAEVIQPLSFFLINHKEIEQIDPESWRLFRDLQEFIPVRHEFNDLLDENCKSEDNINGPLQNWTGFVPKMMHYFLLYFHNYVLYSDRVKNVRTEDPELEEFMFGLEEKFGYAFSDYFLNFVPYPQYLMSKINQLTNFIDHTTPPSPDEKKIATIIDTIKATMQRMQVATQDGIPDTATDKKATYKLIAANKMANYGKWADIQVDNSETRLRGKIISKISKHSQANIDQINAEIEANHIRLRHPNILRLEFYLEDELFHYLVFPNTEGNELYDVLKRNGKLCEEAARPIFRELIQAIQHMHSNGVIHGQISPKCIVFYQDKVRLSDFSLCHMANRGEKRATKLGPTAYMSPEVFKEVPFDGSKNDVWSCGIILYQMLANHHPFVDSKTRSLISQVKRGDVVYPKSFSSSVIFLLKGILNPTPHDRFSIEQILSHPWMLKTHEIPIKYTLNPQKVAARKKKSTVQY